ncbi:MAG TPA: ATP-binding cassette domain-containing protein [Candidatus Limnocylindrales bacterium]|nr:ATP-binding cassette domain-containing protein [Candidatus Limnocylindrales bacterium]
MKNQTSEMISVENLVEVYSDGTKALNGISFKVKEGEFFGFLGPNGAGKSTAIKVLTTLLKKTSGRVSVAGYDLDKSPKEIRKLIGVVNQETVVDVDLTGKENLRLQGRLEQMHGSALESRVEELLKMVQLEEFADKEAGRYSGGMKKRLDLASALIHKPKLLFLDEPTTGLDPQSRASIWDYLETLNREEGITIFLTTQYLEEADRLCRQLCIIDHGKIVTDGSPAELKQAIGHDTITLLLKNPRDAALRTETKRVLQEIDGVADVTDSDGGIVVHAKNGDQIITDVVAILDRNNLRAASLSMSSPTLDDVFLHYTGRRIRAEELGRKTTEAFLM